MKKKLTVADTDTAIEIISELKARVAKLYYIEKKEEYKNVLNRIKDLEEKMYLGQEETINIINKEFAPLLRNMAGDNNE